MKVSELQNKLIEELKILLADWTFMKSKHQFKRAEKEFVWHLHIGCIKHVADFDAVADVCVEFKARKKSLCIVGTKLGNIEGTGQHRFTVSNIEQTKSSAMELHQCFENHGLPFLRKYSDPVTVVNVLSNSGKEAMLISPFLNQHQDQIARLSRHFGIGI